MTLVLVLKIEDKYLRPGLLAALDKHNTINIVVVVVVVVVSDILRPNETPLDSSAYWPPSRLAFYSSTISTAANLSGQAVRYRLEHLGGAV